MAVKSRIDAWTLLRVLVVPCLFLCAIFKRPIFQWIACAVLFVWVCFVISKLFRSHRKHCKKMPAEQKAFPAKQETKPLTETLQEADDDTRLSLLRQVNYRIMEQLKQSYPTVSWLWDTRPSSEDINRGCTKRIKLYHCDPFNFGEVTLSASGKLEIALIQLVPLAEAEVQPKSDEDLEEKDILSRNDVKQWYTETGIALLSVAVLICLRLGYGISDSCRQSDSSLALTVLQNEGCDSIGKSHFTKCAVDAGIAERHGNQLQPSTSKTDKKLLRFFKKFWNIKKASASTLETEVIFQYTKSVVNAKTAAPDYSDATVKLLQMCDFWGILPTSTRIGIRLAHVGIQPGFSVS